MESQSQPSAPNEKTLEGPLRGLDGVPPPLHEVLALLADRLREDPAFPREPVEVLLERLAPLDGVARETLERTTFAQRAGIARLLDTSLDEATRRDLGILVRGLETVVDVVATGADSSTTAADSLTSTQHLDLRYSAADLAELSRACCESFLPLARERDLDLHVDIPDRVAAQVDAGKVQRVILNLLFNAFKLTPPGGHIRYRLEELRRIEEAEIIVVDSGPGVTPGNEEAIFSRNHRSERNAPILRGKLGFDLSISRDMAALHGGSLRLVRSAREVGAELRFGLPTRAPRHVPVARRVEPDAKLAEKVARAASDELRSEAQLGRVEAVRDDRPLVLVVEDSRVMQRILTQALSVSCSVASALDGQDGLRLASELRPSLIISDLRLPKMDGFELVRAIRDRAELAEIPILVVSGTHDAAQTVQLLRAGVQDVMSKPFMVPELSARVHNLLETKRARRILKELSGASETNLGRLAAEVDRHQRKLEATLDELRAARELAESASQVKSNFLRMMSHELKTPVTALVLQQQILASDQHLCEGPRRIAKGMASMSRSVTRLLHIVDTVLEWARVDSGRSRMTLCDVDLVALIRRVVGECQPQAEARGFALDVSVGPGDYEIVSDSRLIRLVAINLIERAIGVAEEGGVDVQLSREPGLARVRVTDSGPSLSKEERELLFDAFGSSVDLGRRGGTGSGLGLQVVRDLAGAIGGTVALVDSISIGTAVDLLLPIAASDTHQLAGEHPEARSPQRADEWCDGEGSG